MTAAEPPEEAPQIEIRFPDDRAAGDYANGFNIFANAHELVIDYLVDVSPPGMVPTVEVVRRLRLPIAMAGAFMKGVAGAMDAYEEMFGPIHQPGQST
jgi:Protein of unknown function (DUF3467)